MLSTDPMVFTAAQLEKVSMLKTKTIVRDKHQFTSPRKIKKVFAPANGVYNSQSLITNPDLAKNKNIHFTVGSPLHLDVKKVLAQEILTATNLKYNQSRQMQSQVTKIKLPSLHIFNPSDLAKQSEINESKTTIAIESRQGMFQTASIMEGKIMLN